MPNERIIGRRDHLLELLQSPERQLAYRLRGQELIGHLQGSGLSAHNACAATACQPLIELGVLPGYCNPDGSFMHAIAPEYRLAEALCEKLKETREFIGIPDLTSARACDAAICGPYPPAAGVHHIYWILRALEPGWYEILDNQRPNFGQYTRRRRLVHTAQTPARGLLRMLA